MANENLGLTNLTVEVLVGLHLTPPPDPDLC